MSRAEPDPTIDDELLHQSVAPDALDGPDAAGRLVRGSALRFLSFAATTLMAVASAAALTRHLGPARFGQYTTITSLVTVVSTVTDSGMSNIGTREYATLEGERRDRLLRNLLGLRVSLTLAGVVIVILWSLAAGYDTALLVGGIGASLATVALVFQHTLTIPLTTDLRIGALSWLEFVRQGLMVAGILTLVLFGAGLTALLSITLLTNAIVIPLTGALVRGRISLRPSWRWSEWAELWRATVVFSLAAGVGTIYFYAAQIVSGFAMSRFQAGLFAYSFRVFIVAAGVPGLIVSSALPVLSRAARNDRDRLAFLLQRIFEASLIGGIGVALAMSAASPFIVSVIAGHRFHEAASVLALQSWALVATFLVANWSYGLLSLHLHRELLIVNAVALLVSVGLTLGLGHVDGAEGAAVATLAGETTVAVGAALAIMSGRPRYRPRIGFAPKPIVAGAIAAVVAYVPPIPSIARAVGAFVVYALVIVALRAVPTEFRELLPKRMR